MDKILNKIFSNKLFIILTPVVTFVLFFIAGFLLGYQPDVYGSVSGYISPYSGGTVGGSTSTKYVFMIRNAMGIWLIGLAVAVLVFLLCVLIQKQYVGKTDNQ